MTSAWGDPAVVLRCGVDRPAAYEPTAQLTSVNDVDWLPVEQDDGSMTFYAAGRVAWVEVHVPDAYEVPAYPLVDLAAAIAGAVPTTP